MRIETMQRQSHILIVEDEPMISEMVSEALAEDGFAVHVAATASEALRYLLAGGQVDVLFTDIDLPGGMDGGALAARVRELRPELPVVYASGKANGLRHVARVPGSIYLEKPYAPETAAAVLARLSEPEQADAA
jgi:DNA-binding NtrC family response regulator